jgi:membrane associated rhomboid family serine protease
MAGVTRRYVIPWLTVTLLAVFVAIFVLEQRFGLEPSGKNKAPAITSLLAFGGLSWALVQQGEFYRMLAAPFLHGSLSHLQSNAIVFALVGYSLERQVGRAWLFCIFAAGGLAGSLMSLLVTQTTVSVGASGGIMAMMAARFFVTFRMPNSRAKMRSQWFTLLNLGMAIYPLFSGAANGVDYGAHLGGAIFGLLIGVLLLVAWSEFDELPPFRLGAAVLAVAALCSFATTAYAVTQRYPQYETLARTLAPANLLPTEGIKTAARARELVQAYPQDPRVLLVSGGYKIDHGDRQGAEDDLRTALPLIKGPIAIVYPKLDTVTRSLLALLLEQEGRDAEARVLAQPGCTRTGAQALQPKLLAQLRKADLCGHSTPG